MLKISNPIGKEIISRKICLRHDLRIGDLFFKADLYVIHTKDFDVILRIEGSSKSLLLGELYDLEKEKLRPMYIGPFTILNKVGPVAYRLALPPNIRDVYNVFRM